MDNKTPELTNNLQSSRKLRVRINILLICNLLATICFISIYFIMQNLLFIAIGVLLAVLDIPIYIIYKKMLEALNKA